MVRAARGSIPRKLPIAASEDHIGDVDTLLAIAGGALERALAPIAAEIDRLLLRLHSECPVMSIQDGLTLATTLTRAGIPYDVTVTFEVADVIPGKRGTWSAPGWSNEYTFEFVSARFECDGPEDGTPITRDEIEHLMKWFYANNFAATDCANDNFNFDEAA